MAAGKSRSGSYWEKHVVSWEAATYFTDKELPQPGLWDRFSILFRGRSLYDRMNFALDLLRPYLKGLTVLDVGCASGRFAHMLLEAGAERVIGVDVSEEIIRIANQRRWNSPYQDRLEFMVADVVQPGLKLPEVHLVTSLGVLEYFDRDDMRNFLANLRAPYFFHDFPDVARTTNWWLWWLRQVYVRVHRCPGVYLYPRQEFNDLVRQAGFQGEIWYVRRSIFHFVSNLPHKPEELVVRPLG